MTRRLTTGLWFVAVLLTSAVLLGNSLAAQETTQTTPQPGQADLQEAMDVHLAARNLNDLERVVAKCEKALKAGLSPEDQELAHNLAASALYQRAQGLSSVVLNRQPRHPRWEQYRELALKDLDKALEHVPDLAEAHELVCQLCSLERGDRERGLKAANEQVRLAGDDKAAQAAAYLVRARFQNDPEAMLGDLAKAAELDPENREALEMRAAILAAQQKYEEAANTLRELIQRDAQEPKFHLALGEILSNIDGKFEEALQEVNRAIELDPKSTQAYLLRARLNTGKENLDAALADLNEALKISSNDLTALAFRAELNLLRDDIKAARDDVDRILRISPDLVLGIMLRSRVNAAAERYEEAIKDMERLVKNDPQNADLRLQLATYYNAADRPRKAIKILTEVVDQDPGNWRALRARGDALLSIGQHADAVGDYEKALKINTDDSGLLNNLAWVLSTSPDDALRNGQRAIELATKACELTEYKEAHILSTLASSYAEAGDFENAIKWSTKAVELGQGEMKEQLQKELESYQQAKPWREKQDTAEKPDISDRDLLET